MNDLIKKIVTLFHSDLNEAKDDINKALKSKLVSDEMKITLKNKFINSKLDENEFIKEYDFFYLNLIYNEHKDFKYLFELFIIVRDKNNKDILNIKDYLRKESLTFELSLESVYNQQYYYSKFVSPNLILLNESLGNKIFTSCIKKQYKGDFTFYKNNFDDFVLYTQKLLEILKSKINKDTTIEKRDDFENEVDLKKEDEEIKKSKKKKKKVKKDDNSDENGEKIENNEEKEKNNIKNEKFEEKEIKNEKIEIKSEKVEKIENNLIKEEKIEKVFYMKFIRQNQFLEETENALKNLYDKYNSNNELINAIQNFKFQTIREKENIEYLILDIKERIQYINKIEVINKKIKELDELIKEQKFKNLINVIKSNIMKEYKDSTKLENDKIIFIKDIEDVSKEKCNELMKIIENKNIKYEEIEKSNFHDEFEKYILKDNKDSLIYKAYKIIINNNLIYK